MTRPAAPTARPVPLLALLVLLRRRAAPLREDRGDVPGWVLVTLMTAGLVVALWAVAGPRFEAVFTQAMDSVVGRL